jgi:hypothetical protein
MEEAYIIRDTLFLSIENRRGTGIRVQWPGSGKFTAKARLCVLCGELNLYRFFPVFWNGCWRIMVSSRRAPVEMIVGFTPQSLQSFST